MTAIINNTTLQDATVVLIPQTVGNATTSKYLLQTTDAVGSTRQVNFTNIGVDGEVVILEVVQSATGTRLVTWGSLIAFGTDITAAVVTTTASKRDYITFRFSKGLNKWVVTNFVKGY
jgi:hypothetical protein